MDLPKKFTVFSSCKVILISIMEEDRTYHTIDAAKVGTRYGEFILLALQDSDTLVKGFLPRRYASVFTDVEIQSINDRTVNLALKFKGKRAETKSIPFAVENFVQ
jgi:hypothetical protein